MNDQGEVIGVVSFTYDKGQNLNLAAPAQRLIDLIGENREYSDQISDPITENQSHP